MTDNHYITVGEIINTHGIKGEVRVKNLSDFPEQRYQVGKQLFLSKQGETIETLTITRYRLHKKFTLLTFAGYDNINDVESFVGCELQITEDELAELESFEFYMNDIIGLSIYADSGEYIGKVTEILETAANDVWVVARAGKKDLLLPFIESVILSVDLKEKKALVHILEGLRPEDAY